MKCISIREEKRRGYKRCRLHIKSTFSQIKRTLGTILRKIQSLSRFVTFIKQCFRYGDCCTNYNDKCMHNLPCMWRSAVDLQSMHTHQPIGRDFCEQHNWGAWEPALTFQAHQQPEAQPVLKLQSSAFCPYSVIYVFDGSRTVDIDYFPEQH